MIKNKFNLINKWNYNNFASFDCIKNQSYDYDYGYQRRQKAGSTFIEAEYFGIDKSSMINSLCLDGYFYDLLGIYGNSDFIDVTSPVDCGLYVDSLLIS